MPSPKAPAQNRPESPSSVSPIVDVKVRVHDFSKAIEAHVQSSPLAPEVARKNAIAQLLAVPNHHDSLLKSKEIAPGKFQVVATNHTHQYLDGIAEWMAKGEKQIVVETRMVTVSESELTC